MRKILWVVFLLPFISEAQTLHKYFIRFTDKNNNGFSTNDPAAFLSQRAIDRRNRQAIAIDQKDLPVTANYILGVANSGARVISRSKWLNGVVVECDSSTLPSINSLPYVLNTTPIARFVRPANKSLEVAVPAAEPLQRNASLNYGLGYNQIHMINGDYLHDLGYTGQGMLIAMMDNGYNSADSDPVFDSVRSNNQIIATYDFVNNESSVYEDGTHGMMTFSCIAANLPNQLIGTAPSASFLLLKTEDDLGENLVEEYFWASGAEFADSAGADVISSSLGYTTFDDPSMNHTYADMDGNTCPSSIAADIAASRGILVFVSAGNLGQSPWLYLSAPSDADSVVSVGAVDMNGEYAGFSSRGPSSDGDIKPNLVTQGSGSAIAFPGGVGSGSGTSFSCPILAGAATCFWQAFPNKTNIEIKQAIEQSATLFNSPNDSMGYGIPNFMLALVILSDKINNIAENVQLFPNPATNYVNVFAKGFTSTSNVKIVSSIGLVVKEETVKGEAFTINTSSLTKGVYLLEIVNAIGSVTKRLIVE